MNKVILLVSLPILLSLVFLGYWLLIRPSMIRSECYKDVKRAIDEPGEALVSHVNHVYRLCLVSHGFKPEDLAN